MLVASKGGHFEQAVRFSKALPPIIERQFVTDQQAEQPQVAVVLKRVVDYDRKNSTLTKLVRILQVILSASRLIRKERPELIVTFGAAFCVPVAVSAKFMGVEVLHVESWSRISTISNTTKFMRMFRLCKATAYQYEESPLGKFGDCRYIGHL